jgi:hypothetical protein
MAKRRSRKLLEADRFRARVVLLLRVAHADWNEWEQDWLQNEAQRPDDTIYSEKERVILDQLLACATTFTQYAEWSVRELLDTAYPYRADLDEDDAAFLERLCRWCATDLKVRQINRLAGLVRLTEFLPRDETVADVMRATRKVTTSAMPLSGMSEADADAVNGRAS